MSDQVRLKNTLGGENTPWEQRHRQIEITWLFTAALILTTFLSFIVWIEPDSRSPWKALYFVYVILFLALLWIMGPDVPARSLFAYDMVLSLVMLVGEWLFSPNAVLTFFVVFLVAFLSLLVKTCTSSLFAFCCHLCIMVLVVIALRVAIFPVYDGVWEPAVAGAIAGSITFYSSVPRCFLYKIF